jgi:DNA (cytosine-5)-methyltransferase 1
MSLDLTVTDLFCGAGGSSIGAELAGATLKMAANHWSLAIETHNANFPDAAHDCADVSQVDPRRYPSTDVLIASPECTHHSQARTRRHVADLFDPTGDPAAERSRATMWDVVRFTERHSYQLIVVENVVEIVRWAPFDAWLSAMHALGYRHELVCLNSMVAPPTPQSRDRIYVVFWKAGNRAPDLRFTPSAWCPTCEGDVEAVQSWKVAGRTAGKYRQQYLYRCPACSGVAWPYAWPAASAIDWSLPTPRVGDRARPLAAATLRRIAIGLERFGVAVVQKSGHTYEAPGTGYARAWPVEGPMPTQTTETHHALACPPFMVNASHTGSPARYAGNRVRPMEEPLGTQPASNTHALVVPVHHGGGGPQARPADQPWPTQTGRQEQALVVPLRTHGSARPAVAPFQTMVAGNQGHALATLPFIAELRGGWSDARAVFEPLAAVCASGNHHALVDPGAFYLKNYGDGTDPSMMHPVTDPLGAVTTHDHHSVVRLPFTVDYHGNGRAQPVDQPLPTQDTRDRHALVEPGIAVEDCGFRMLEPDEIGRAMAFPTSYTVLGNKRQRVRQYGNAVTPPVMTMILARCIGSLAS